MTARCPGWLARILRKRGLVLQTEADALNAALIADCHRILNFAGVTDGEYLPGRLHILVADRDEHRTARVLLGDELDRAADALSCVQAHARAMRGPLELPRFVRTAA